MRFKCPECGTWVTVNREVPEGYTCAKCSFSHWRNDPEPTKEYRLSENDRIFLRVQRILPEI